MYDVLIARPPAIAGYVYGSFTTAGPVTSLGATLKAFWTADDHGTANMTDDGAGLISAWAPQVGGPTLTAATTARPTWSATSFNGLAGVTGDGVANVLNAAATTGLPAATAESWIICLCDHPSTGSTPRLFGYGGASNFTGRTIFKNSVSFAVIIEGSSFSATASPAWLGRHLVEAQFVEGGASTAGWFDGKQTSPTGSTGLAINTATTRTRMFSSVAVTPANFSTATVRYLMVTGALTTLQRQQIEGWMVWGGGVQNQILPSTHPFRYRRP